MKVVKRGRETYKLFALALAEYWRLAQGNEVYDEDGARFRVTSLQKWATRPDELDINLAHGLYEHYTVRVRGNHVSIPLFRTSRQMFKEPKGVQGLPVKIGGKLETREPITFGKSSVPAGAVGVLQGVHPLTPDQSKLYHGGQRALLTVKFDKGGTFFNVYPRQVKAKKPRLSR